MLVARRRSHHAGKRQMTAPEVSEFWSITVYGCDDRLMAHNAINRHSRGRPHARTVGRRRLRH